MKVTDFLPESKTIVASSELQTVSSGGGSRLETGMEFPFTPETPFVMDTFTIQETQEKRKYYSIPAVNAQGNGNIYLSTGHLHRIIPADAGNIQRNGVASTVTPAETERFLPSGTLATVKEALTGKTVVVGDKITFQVPGSKDIRTKWILSYKA